MIFSRLENIELEKRTNLRVGSSDFISSHEISIGNHNIYIFNYVYNYTDHLGNIRLSYTKDPVNGQIKVMEENHYYPFRLKHAVYSGSSIQNYQLVDNMPGNEPIARPTYVLKTDYQYKYNGKELQDELGLNMYDMDMRQYDPAIARWVALDPVIHHSMSPYNAFDNNPVFWADPSGANAENLGADTDFKFNEKTGEITQVGETNDKPDRILKTDSKGEVKLDKNGEAKVAMDGIAKGILKDGMNFKNDNNTIAVNGKNTDGSLQPTTEQVEKFAVGFANKVLGTEMSGYTLGYNNKVTNILIEKTKGNSSIHANSMVFEKDRIPSATTLNLKEGQYNSGFGVQSHFHTHLDAHGPANHPSSEPGQDTDHKKATKGLSHYIINSNGKFPF